MTQRPTLTRRALLGAGIAALTMGTAAACGGTSTDPLANSSTSAAESRPSPTGQPLVIGSANFTESEVLAEIYAAALAKASIAASTQTRIGTREVYLQALKDKSISIVPEYTGNLLQYLDQENPATQPADIVKALPDAVGPELAVLNASTAADQDVYVVTKKTSDAKGITSLADLKKISSSSVLGGPSELKDRAYGPPGLKQIYGATFKQFKAYDALAVKVKDLKDDKIQVASFFSTDAALIDNPFVVLTDPENMILPQQVIPLVRAEVATNKAATDTLNKVQQALTTEALAKLNRQVDVEHTAAKVVAQAWVDASLG